MPVSSIIPKTHPFLKWAGGKRQLLAQLNNHFPAELENGLITRYVEPFVGSGAVFFDLFLKFEVRDFLIADVNPELILVYQTIQRQVEGLIKQLDKIERDYLVLSEAERRDFYYQIRSQYNHQRSSINYAKFDSTWVERAAYMLFLNRTGYNGLFRLNSKGEFNVGYGGQDRRWVISKEGLVQTAKRLSRVCLRCSDFEHIIDACEEGDFVFVDPPYRPAERDMIHDHYRYGKFTFDDHKRLAATLKRASKRGVRWAMTTSAHPEILHLSRQSDITRIARGTGKRIGELKKGSGEVLIRNYEEVDQ